jgi:hypothetical protein
VFFCSGLGFEGAKSIYDDIDHSIFVKLQVRTIVELFQHHHWMHPQMGQSLGLM